jgi:poly(3-hydroxybutyrate) depolymerase
MKLSTILVILPALLCAHASAKVLEKSGTFGGLKIDYKVVLPDGYDAAKTYPAILAFPGGSQDMQIVDGGLSRYWREQGEKRGYILISPASPDGNLFFEQNARIFPQFLDMIGHDYKLEGGKMHVAGFSNGGVTAFYVAAQYPKYFWSVTGMPGLLDPVSDAKIAALKPMCIYMHVGGLDSGWRESMEQQSKTFAQKGLTVKFRVEPDQSHVLSLDREGVNRLFEQIGQAAHGCAK